MKKFEEELRENMTQERPISTLARKSMDDAYAQIRQQQVVKPKKKRGRGLLLAAVILLGFSGLMVFTPAGKAMGNFLRFGQFSSKTLQDSGFVTEQDAVAEDQEITVHLKEIYTDELETGIHLQLDLPKNEKLLTEDLEYYEAKFAIKNNAGQFIVDFNTGLSEGQEKLGEIRSISFEDRVDKENGRIDLLITCGSLVENLQMLEGAELIVTKIDASYPHKEHKPGLRKIKMEAIEGNWVMPIKNEMLKHYDPISFVPEDPSLAAVCWGTVYPTSFVLNIDQNSELFASGALLADYDKVFVSSDVESKKGDFYAKGGSSVFVGDKEVHQTIFRYSEYDTHSKVYIHLGERVIPMVMAPQ